MAYVPAWERLSDAVMRLTAAGLSEDEAQAEVHAERGGPERSVAMIVRSERMVGRFKQHIFDLEKNAVVEAWGPEQVPYELA